MEYGFNKVKYAKSREFAAKFGSHIKNIPMYITVNGLIPTIAFIMSKATKNKEEAKSYSYIGEIIIEYLIKIGAINQISLSFERVTIRDFENLVQELFAKSTSEYRRCTLEILSMLEWMVKFADGMIEDKEDEAKNKEDKVNPNEG